MSKIPSKPAVRLRRPNYLVFNVGPFEYRLVISDRQLYDSHGDELSGCAIESRRLLIVSYCVEPARREEIALHELKHAWLFHFPKPHDDEERCQFFAATTLQLRIDLDAQGGTEAMKRLRPTRVPNVGRGLHEWLSPEAAGERLSVPVRSIRRLVAAKKLNAIEFPEFPGSDQKTMRIELADFERFIRRHKLGAKGGAA